MHKSVTTSSALTGRHEEITCPSLVNFNCFDIKIRMSSYMIKNCITLIEVQQFFFLA